MFNVFNDLFLIDISSSNQYSLHVCNAADNV